MSYHSTNLGAFARIVAPVTDIDGYVPQSLEDVASLRWPEPNELDDPDAAAEFLALALALTAQASDAVDDWRNPDRSLGETIRDRRRNRDLTQTQLAEATGVPQHRVSAYERGDTTPSIETLEALATALGPFAIGR